jgi:predicted TIM-barrel fold metal-dependent hydrolase
MNRREILTMSLAAGALSAQTKLPLEEYQPKSMLAVPERPVERARFPVVDIHAHLSWCDTRLKGGESLQPLAAPADLLAVMDRRNIRLMVNLTGGHGKALEEAIQLFQKPHPDRFLTFVEPWWARAADPGYAQFQAGEVERAHRAGARGIKILKILGLFLREQITSGPLVKVDDPRFDPMWEAAGSLRMPVAIHVSDPRAFFLPTDRFNERYEELNAHPDWSFNGRDYPSNMELQQARLRVLARHPKTQFLCLHVADAEDLAFVSQCMDRHPNMWVEFGARIGELGRQPRAARRFFDRYQDRICFGTDAVPNGKETPQQIFCDDLYRIYYRFLETEDEYFDYAPAPVPPQGRWRIYGLGLSEPILRKVYHDNAARLLGLGQSRI